MAGATPPVHLPQEEGQAYDFTITGPDGFEKRFTGVAIALVLLGGAALVVFREKQG